MKNAKVRKHKQCPPDASLSNRTMFDIACIYVVSYKFSMHNNNNFDRI